MANALLGLAGRLVTRWNTTPKDIVFVPRQESNKTGKTVLDRGPTDGVTATLTFDLDL